MARDKDAPGIFAELAPRARACVATAAAPVRSTPPDELVPPLWASGVEEVEAVAEPLAARARARSLARADELVVATGSLYLAGALRPALVAGANGV